MPELTDEYWDRIGGKVLSEVERRLDGGDVKDLPGTLLMRLAELYLKRLEQKAKEEEEELHYMSALEAIDQEGLPVESKIQILTDYLAKLESDREEAEARLAELQLEVINGLQKVHEPDSPTGEGSVPSKG